MVVPPSFTMGGLGSGFAYTRQDLVPHRRRRACTTRPTTEVLLEESILGWKEYELELMRDTADNTVVVCSIENVDPVGVHTGDSITVAPALTLTDREYQKLRDIGIDDHPRGRRRHRRLQHPVRRRPGRGPHHRHRDEPARLALVSALASKATGFPIAKIAAKLAIGYRLDEIPNDITAVTPASFEPTLDYVVVKVPRFAFEKFPAADPTLTTTMKSVGEAMAIGRNFADGAAEGAALAREARLDRSTGATRRAAVDELARGSRRPPTDGRHRRSCSRRCARAPRSSRSFEATEHRPVVPRPDRAHQRGRATRARRRASSTRDLLRIAKEHGF